MIKKYNIAIVGATGIVGETLLSILSERNFPIENLFPLASERSVGDTVLFQEKSLTIDTLNHFDFSKVDFAFFAAGADISAEYAPLAAKAGCIVIDKSTAFRNDKKVPLVVPEVNPDALKNFKKGGIIANPNCTTIPIVAALKPIYDHFGILRMNIATYQSVSGAGKQGIAALAAETAELLNGQPVDEPVLHKQIAFNVLPKIDEFSDNGYTLEEMKLVWETQKILNDKKILVNPTAVRVPVFFGHSASVHLETKEFAEIEKVKSLLKNSPGISVVDDGDYPTPITHAANNDDIFVGRIRKDLSHKNGINLWIVADNVRKGAALNAIQIAELIILRDIQKH